jgi:competence protein ComEA
MAKNLLRLLCALMCLMAVPFASAESSAKSKSAETPKVKAAAKVDLNTADQATLETLPGIGPATARAIIAARPFSKVDDLENVPGIGPSKMADLRDRVRVSHPTASAAKKSTDKATKSSETATAKKSARASETARSERTTPAERRATADSQSAAATTTRDRTPEPTGLPSQTRRPTTSPATPSTGLINLNTATLEQLEALPEIGPVKAQAIIDARPFSSIEDVMRVKGIKEATFDAIKDRITVQ